MLGLPGGEWDVAVCVLQSGAHDAIVDGFSPTKETEFGDNAKVDGMGFRKI
jgi:hypothetical protein